MNPALPTGEQFPRELEILRHLADNLPQIVWVTRPDGSHEYYNRRWYDFTGLTLATSTEQGWNDLFHPDDVESANAAWAEALRTGNPYDIEFRLRRASDGEYRWFLGRALPYRNETGEITNWFGTCTDIHEQKLAEEALRGARDAIRKESQRKDEFLGMISHELRTPLNAVFGWTRLMQENVLNEDERKEAVNSIMRNAEAQARLIEDVLDITRIINQKLSLDRAVLDVVPIVREAVEAVQPSADVKGIALEAVLDADELLVDADRMRLQQVVLNLLTNAVKFTPRGGQIRVRATRDRAFAMVEVTDTGKGIDADLLPHIFERFRQGDSSSTRHHGGLGLGLTIAHQLLMLHGGTIEVESEGHDKGSRFSVLLPIVAVDMRASSKTSSGAAGDELFPISSLRGVHVMVVDDEASVRDLVALTLAKCGASVTVASSVQDAIGLMPNLHPDVVVTDIAMPGIDGYEFVQRLRAIEQKRGREIPIIALTAYASVQDRNRALDAGFDRHLTKPVDPGELVRAIVKTRSEKAGATTDG
ncbi:MAG: ATP-binding protein [Verrucomicrobiota bacterium]|nr:ATP-binding protein [Verrucomicrobiota bacterium]